MNDSDGSKSLQHNIQIKGGKQTKFAKFFKGHSFKILLKNIKDK